MNWAHLYFDFERKIIEGIRLDPVRIVIMIMIITQIIMVTLMIVIMIKNSRILNIQCTSFLRLNLLGSHGENVVPILPLNQLSLECELHSVG